MIVLHFRLSCELPGVATDRGKQGYHLKNDFSRVSGRVMGRGAMQPVLVKIFAIVLLTSPAAYGQSLGDIARENREKQNAEDGSLATPKPKVITNADLPKDPNAGSPQPQSAGNIKVADPHSADLHSADRRSAQQTLAQQRAADQWKRQILAQKSKMATLQERVDQLNASIRSMGGSAETDGPYNHDQARELQRLVQVQQQLNEQKRKLDEMQEAARRAGLHSAVYDP
jgi:hypothetical protein